MEEEELAAQEPDPEPEVVEEDTPEVEEVPVV